MHCLISTMCWGVLGSSLVLAQPAIESHKQLDGTWIATAAERDGSPASDVVGHRLSISGDQFQISKDGKSFYEGKTRSDPTAKPAMIDFEHTQGLAKGNTWKGIYALDGGTLTICDNAQNLDAPRPTAFEAKVGSGYDLVIFNKAKP